MSNTSMTRTSVLTLVLGLGLAPAAGALDAGATAEEVLDCAARNTPEESYQQAARMRVESEGRVQREVLATIAAQGGDKGLRVNFGVKSPADLAGTSILVRSSKDGKSEDLKIYLPGLQRVRNVVGAMAEKDLLGTDFSYSDLRRIYGTFDQPEVERVPDRDGDGVLAVRLVAPETSEAEFSRILARFAVDTCVLVDAEFERKDGTMRKRLEGDLTTLMMVGERKLLTRYRMETPDAGTATVVDLGEPQFDERISAAAFHSTQFHRFHNRVDLPPAD